MVDNTIHTLAIHRQKLAYLKGKPENLTLFVYDFENNQTHPVVENIRCSESFMRLVWSVDGKKIYTAMDKDGNWFHDLWAVDIESGEMEQLTDYFHTNSFPVDIHPDGETVLLLSNLRGEMNVRIYNITSKDMRKLTDYAQPVISAVYSPDGGQIAYTANATDNTHNTDIYIMNADGFDKRKALSTLAGAFDRVCGWCSNGRYLAIESNYEGMWRAGVYDLRELTPKWLTQTGETSSVLAFSPDNAHILIDTDDTIFIVELKTMRRIPIKADSQRALGAAWVGDNRVVFSTDDSQLHLFDMDNRSSNAL